MRPRTLAAIVAAPVFALAVTGTQALAAVAAPAAHAAASSDPQYYLGTLWGPSVVSTGPMTDIKVGVNSQLLTLINKGTEDCGGTCWAYEDGTSGYCATVTFSGTSWVLEWDPCVSGFDEDQAFSSPGTANYHAVFSYGVTHIEGNGQNYYLVANNNNNVIYVENDISRWSTLYTTWILYT